MTFCPRSPRGVSNLYDVVPTLFAARCRIAALPSPAATEFYRDALRRPTSASVWPFNSSSATCRLCASHIHKKWSSAPSSPACIPACGSRVPCSCLLHVCGGRSGWARSPSTPTYSPSRFTSSTSWPRCRRPSSPRPELGETRTWRQGAIRETLTLHGFFFWGGGGRFRFGGVLLSARVVGWRSRGVFCDFKLPGVLCM